ncbi:MAG TPA: hypothetical protein VK864_15000, partial [Longimicrobiales bacterium]|nr:hypothetical protein [Longimicrobiales bacterium]
VYNPGGAEAARATVRFRAGARLSHSRGRMDTCVSLVNAYLRFNGYVVLPEQPVLVGEGRPYRYHTATDVDILAVRFPNAAVVVPRDSGEGGSEEDLHLEIDPELKIRPDTVDVIVAEVKQSRPRLNPALREADVLYATLRRVDPGFDEPLRRTIGELIRRGEAECESGGRHWRFRLFAFGEGVPVVEQGPFFSFQLSHVAMFLIQCMREHHQVWKDAQFGDPVLDLLHLFDKMGFTWIANDQVERAALENEPVTEVGLEERDPGITAPTVSKPRAKRVRGKTRALVNELEQDEAEAAVVRDRKPARKRRGPAKKKSPQELTPRVHANGRHRKSP